MSVTILGFISIESGWLMLIEVSFVQPASSVMVKLYNPVSNAEISSSIELNPLVADHAH